MIEVHLQRDANGGITAFTAKNHGASETCAAVSLMIINTVNSIEALTNQAFSCDYNENGGFIQFSLTERPQRDTALLLNAMHLGLRAVQQQYPGELALRDASTAEKA